MIKYKIVLLGDQSVGKTSIINRFIYETFEGHEQPTVGIDFISKSIHLDNNLIRLQIWDTAGQERFRSLIPNYLRDIHAAVLVYDVTSRQTFNHLEQWLQDIYQQNSADIVVCIVGNKTDLLEGKENMQAQEGVALAKKHNLIYIETSAKVGTNVNNIFQLVTSQLLGTDLANSSQFLLRPSNHNHLNQLPNASSNTHKLNSNQKKNKKTTKCC